MKLPIPHVDQVLEKKHVANMVQSLMHEVFEMLQNLGECNDENAIDLSSLPAPKEVIDGLKKALGIGEVEAKVDVFGLTVVQETKYHGVWWISHLDASKRLIGETIEIALVPEILKSNKEDVLTSTELLQQHLSKTENLQGNGS